MLNTNRCLCAGFRYTHTVQSSFLKKDRASSKYLRNGLTSKQLYTAKVLGEEDEEQQHMKWSLKRLGHKANYEWGSIPELLHGVYSNLQIYEEWRSHRCNPHTRCNRSTQSDCRYLSHASIPCFADRLHMHYVVIVDWLLGISWISELEKREAEILKQVLFRYFSGKASSKLILRNAGL